MLAHKNAKLKILKPWQAYIFAAVAVFITLAFRLAIDGLLGGQAALIIFTVPIMLSAYVGGLHGGLMATSLAYFGASYFLLPPVHTLIVESNVERFLQFFLVLTGVIISFLNQAMHRASHQADLAKLDFQKANERANLSFKEAEDLRTALDEHAIVAITDHQGKITFVNDKFCEISKYSRDELLGRDHRMINSGYHPKEYIRNLWMTISQGKVWHGELKNRAKDGSLYWVATTIVPFLNEHSKPRQYVAIRADITSRKIAEEAAAQLAAIVKSSEDGIIGKDLDGLVTSWNGGAEKIFGYSSKEMIGQSITRLIPNERLNEEAEILNKIRHGGSIRHFETVRLRKDGSAIEVSVTISAIYDTEGEIIGASKVIRDITERKLVERALSESDQRMHLATKATAVGIWEWNVITNRIRWDSQMFNIYGIAPTEDGYIEYNTWRDRVLPEDLESQENELQKTVREIGSSERKFRIVRLNDGECRSIKAVEKVRTNLDGQAEWVVGTNLDITEIVKTAAALQASEEQFRTMVNAISQLAWIAKADGYIIWYNERWYEYTGTTADDMEGWGWQRVHDPAILPNVLVKWKAAIAASEPFEMEFPLRGANGEFLWFLTRAYPLKDDGGNVTRWFGTNTDISKIREAEAQIQRLNHSLEDRIAERTSQLELANKELEAFSYSVSHDLRAPLRHIDGYIEILTKRLSGVLDEKNNRYLQVISEAAKQMGRLIDDLLAFSRMSRTEMIFEELDMALLVKVAIKDLTPEIKGRNINWNISKLPVIQGDMAMMRLVFANLLSNAAKYTRRCEVAEIEIGAEVKPEEIIVFIRDNGVGFDMKYADKLFGVFERLHRAEDFEGTGIGLANVHRIISRLGGRTWADGKVDEGACFYFSLPNSSKKE